MTASDLGRDLGRDLGPAATPAERGLSDELGSLFVGSPARPVSTSAAAGTAFVLGLLGVMAAPFSATLTLCLALGGTALVSGVIGLGRASRPTISGGLLASLGLVLALITLALMGLRYLGLDTAFGDALAPTLLDWLAALNTLVPAP